ncbi:MAG: hypothetical protein LBQ01_02590 [Prevotellaceae bacterium]|jgi:hypothetical protein|nr:hypothetical protein [Prevotellaceae bacterium]
MMKCEQHKISSRGMSPAVQDLFPTQPEKGISMLVFPPQPARRKLSMLVFPPQPAGRKLSMLVFPPQPAERKLSMLVFPPQPAERKLSMLAVPSKAAEKGMLYVHFPVGTSGKKTGVRQNSPFFDINIPRTVYFCELDMRPACRQADEAIRDSSSLRGAQRRSNPEGRGFLDCFVASAPRNDDKSGIVSSLILRQASSRFQFRYETGIRNDEDSEKQFSAKKTHNSHPFDV